MYFVVSTNTRTLMKIVSIIFLQFLSNFIFAQNGIEVNQDKASIAFYKDLSNNLSSYNLDSIQNSDEKTIRIWQGQSVLTFDHNAQYLQKFTNLKTNLDYFYHKAVTSKLDSFNISKIKKLDYNYHIDCFPTAIEIKENNHYFLKVVGCNKEISLLTNRIFSNEIQADIQRFIGTLPSGEYRQGMTTFTINQNITDNSQKTNLYKKIEAELLKTGIKVKNPREQPLILINSIPSYFEDINKLGDDKFYSYRILSKDLQSSAIYGTRAQYGVVIIETK